MTTTVRIDPRIKRTRQLLQHAFIELMQEKGFSAISIQEIAERATVNRATFYAHFETKYQLLDSLIREQIRQLFASRLPSGLRWEESTLRILIQTVLEYVQETQNYYCSSAKTLHPMMERAVQEELFDFLMILLPPLEVSEPAPSMTRELLALTSSWAIFGTAVQWSRDPQVRSVENMTDALLTVLTRGVTHLTPGFVQP